MSPAAPLPAEVEEFLREPHPAVVATLRADGSPHSVPTWYDWTDGLVLMWRRFASRRWLVTGWA